MLTREENELLARTGPGTPMGRLMRRYWVPVLFSHQLPERDGPPVRVKILCEKLVAFRDFSGKVGLVDERCPHRGEVAPTDFGFVAGTGREAGNGDIYWTASVMLMPFHKLISRHAGPDSPIGAHVWVPIDDENTMNYSVEYHPERPLEEAEMVKSKTFQYIHTENLPGTDRSVQNCDNDYLIDRARQKSGESYTGIRGIGMQDCALQESMGPISDRTTEHLGVSDTVIIKLRKVMLRTLKDMTSGAALPGLDPASWRVRSTAFTVPASQAFADVVDDHVRAETHATS